MVIDGLIDWVYVEHVVYLKIGLFTTVNGLFTTVNQRSDLSPRPAQVRSNWVDIQAGV